MELINIVNDKVVSSSNPVAQGVRYGNLIFLSGQLGKNITTGKLEENFEDEVRQVMENLKTLLVDSGSSMDKVIKTTIFLTDLSKTSIVNQIYKEYFTTRIPARSCIGVQLGGGAEIEIELIAAI